MADELLWCNFPEPVELHDYRYLGRDFRERERIARRRRRWLARLAKMPVLERQALVSALLAMGPGAGTS
jgi:DNA adenine methylase